MKIYTSLVLSFLCLVLISSCKQDSPNANGQVDDLLWLENKGAQMPIWVQGKASSETFILFLHGGPGGSSLVYNDVLDEMSEGLEKQYAVAYWDQRSSGNAKGNYDKEDVSLEQMKDDLDQVIDLLKHKYGTNISVFLLGHSWGGYLGNYYLLDKIKQQKVKGWIDVDGAHNIRKLSLDALALMQEVAEQQIQAQSAQKEDWEKILEFATEFDTTKLDERDSFLEINAQAGKAETLALLDELVQTGSSNLNGLWQNISGANHPLTGLTNNIQLQKTRLIDEAIDFPLSDELDKIKIPALLLWGKYDFVVPPSLGEEMLANLGTLEDRKSLIIYEASGHSPMGTETEDFIQDLVDFIEVYK